MPLDGPDGLAQHPIGPTTPPATPFSALAQRRDPIASTSSRSTTSLGRKRRAYRPILPRSPKRICLPTTTTPLHPPPSRVLSQAAESEQRSPPSESTSSRSIPSSSPPRPAHHPILPRSAERICSPGISTPPRLEPIRDLAPAVTPERTSQKLVAHTPIHAPGRTPLHPPPSRVLARAAAPEQKPKPSVSTSSRSIPSFGRPRPAYRLLLPRSPERNCFPGNSIPSRPELVRDFAPAVAPERPSPNLVVHAPIDAPGRARLDVRALTTRSPTRRSSVQAQDSEVQERTTSTPGRSGTLIDMPSPLTLERAWSSGRLPNQNTDSRGSRATRPTRRRDSAQTRNPERVRSEAVTQNSRRTWEPTHPELITAGVEELINAHNAEHASRQQESDDRSWTQTTTQ